MATGTLGLNAVGPLTTILEEFAALGGLAVLSQHLPMLLCASASPSLLTFDNSITMKATSGHSQPMATASTTNQGNNISGVVSENIDSWVKLDGGSEDLDEEMDEILVPPGYMPLPTPQYMNHKRSKTAVSTAPTYALPLHSLAAFSLFLSIPLYTEAVLQDRRRAQMLLRLALGVADDGHGGNILNSSDAALFPILPFMLLQQVLDNHSLRTEKGSLLRQQAVDMGVLQLLLACLAVFTQQISSANVKIPVLNVQFVVGVPSALGISSSSSSSSSSSAPAKNENGEPSNSTAAPAAPGVTAVSGGSQQHQQQYWAKGTGFGTGSTAQTWDLDGAMHRQRQQEEQATCLLHTLSAYIHPVSPDQLGSPPAPLPTDLLSIIQSSHLVTAICSYLRNDSVMDMARHVPLYKALLLLLRSIASCPELIPLLLPSSTMEDSRSSDAQSIHSLLHKLKNYVSSYTARLASVTSNQQNRSNNQEDSDSEEGIADLSKDICNTWAIAKAVVLDHLGGDDIDGGDGKTLSERGILSLTGRLASAEMMESRSPEKLYCDIMQPLQFDSYELLVESSDCSLGSRFTVAYHFENTVRLAGDRCHPNRMKRLAQEVATLTTSLPLSCSSSVFVRCDTDRLDIMKVLITGPSDTPYGNGCFEFDVYFPPDYPQSPMQVHLATTGRHTIRFNPNLYNDGKVCLSVLNTWHGRPEEKWNPHTSSLLQVLVSIQSLILVSEPYFNEPGYERSRGTPSGNQNSRDYDVNIRQATVKWAMLEQIRNPAPCFKQVTHTHFWLKRNEIEKQCEEWISDMEGQVESDPNGSRAVSVGLASLKRHYSQLKEELLRLNTPSSLADAVPPTEAILTTELAEESSTLSNKEFSITLDDNTEEVSEMNEILKDVAELDKINEMIFSNIDGAELAWKENFGEEDSEAELDNFVSQFTI